MRGKRVLDDVMVRRLKEDLREIQGGFPKRNVERMEIAGLPEDAPELALSRLLNEYRTTREKRHAGASGKARAAAGLLVVGLQQRLLSSIEAFARSLRVHRKTVERHRQKSQPAAVAPDAPAPRAGDPVAPAPRAGEPVLFLKAPDADDERADWTGEESEAEEKEQIEAITLAAEADGPADADAALWAREQRLIDRMQAIADESRHLPDAKTRRLIDWIRENQCPALPPFGRRPAGGAPPGWNARRVLIFTENREGTKRHLRDVLDQAVEYTDRAEERIEVIDGLTSGAAQGDPAPLQC